jgi:hypothetical protein
MPYFRICAVVKEHLITFGLLNLKFGPSSSPVLCSCALCTRLLRGEVMSIFLYGVVGCGSRGQRICPFHLARREHLAGKVDTLDPCNLLPIKCPHVSSFYFLVLPQWVNTGSTNELLRLVDDFAEWNPLLLATTSTGPPQLGLTYKCKVFLESLQRPTLQKMVPN